MDCGFAVVTATALEAREARRALPYARVYEAGVGLRAGAGPWGDVVLSCGLAGALAADLPPGTVLVPDTIGCPDGSRRETDRELSAACVTAARFLGFEPVRLPLLTSATIVRGAERAEAARGGYAAVDMESGLLDAPRVAALRVVLDTPARELRGDWLRPARAVLDPRNWPELVWLARDGPRFARRAAEIAAAACAYFDAAGDAALHDEAAR
jgi:hypothetical protein